MAENAQPSERVDDRPQRRSFTSEYKHSVLKELDSRREERGVIGEILRREGLYGSQVATWRREVPVTGLSPQRRGPKADASLPLRKENERLEKQNAKLRKQLERARLIIEAQKKIAAMFPEESEMDEGSAS
jgi:transposase-like protein